MNAKKKYYQLGIFDWSGVISNDLTAVFNSVNEILKQHKKPKISLEKFKETTSLNFENFWEIYNLDYKKKKIQQKWNQIYETERGTVEIFSYAKNAILKTTSSVPQIGICSSHPQHFLKDEVKKYKLNNSFNHIKGSCQDKLKYLQQILLDLKIPPNDTFFVGDMVEDIIAGKEAGMMTYAVLSGYHSRQKLEKQKPDGIFNNISEFVKIL
jgi:phosphoglycolate phosphatase